VAIGCTKPGGVIHFYHFGERDTVEETACNKIIEIAKKVKRGVEIVSTRIVRQYSPTIIQVVVDGRIR
jgi:tRNA G37 N-methylase Trm5